MRYILTILFCFTVSVVIAQNDQSEVESRMKRLHESMVQNETSIDQYIDESLSYGHSSGWVENKNDFLSNLKRGWTITQSRKTV